MTIPHKPPVEADYPATWVGFLDCFHSEQACRDYLVKLRWPSGMVCPKCGTISPIQRVSRGRYICPSCSHQASVTAGTIFDKTRTELRVWFAAIWYITNQKQGVSALGLQRVLGLGSYETAWTMLHRLRRAMVRPDRDLLHGEVEVDETYLALTDRQNPTPTKKRQGNASNIQIAVAVEIIHPKGFGRIRVQQIKAGDQTHLLPFIQASVLAGTKIRTDGSPAYRNLKASGYEHQQTVHLGAKTPAHESMPGVHRVAALLQRWMMGTHHGAVRPAQLDYYLDEFVFRFNRRTSRSRGLLFYRLLQQAVLTKPVTYGSITGGTQK